MMKACVILPADLFIQLLLNKKLNIHHDALVDQ